MQECEFKPEKGVVLLVICETEHLWESERSPGSGGRVKCYDHNDLVCWDFLVSWLLRGPVPLVFFFLSMNFSALCLKARVGVLGVFLSNAFPPVRVAMFLPPNRGGRGRAAPVLYSAAGSIVSPGTPGAGSGKGASSRSSAQINPHCSRARATWIFPLMSIRPASFRCRA